jgi:hypothetical protein
MNLLFILAILLTSNPLPPPQTVDDPARIADVMDTSETASRVSGLHYCYEESEGNELYINKYDWFFVQRGEAVITVAFEDLARITFEKGIKEEKGRSFREAVILMRSGKTVNALILCHPGSFIKGRVDLGEFRLDMEKIDTMNFLHGIAPKPAGFLTRVFPKAETPGGALPLTLTAAGDLKIEGRVVKPQTEALKKELSQARYTVFLRAEPHLPYSVLVKHLKRLQEAGVQSVFLGP